MPKIPFLFLIMTRDANINRCYLLIFIGNFQPLKPFKGTQAVTPMPTGSTDSYKLACLIPMTQCRDTNT